MNNTQKQAGWGFWLLWIAASAIGIFLGVVAAFIIGSFVSDVLGNTAGGIVVGLILGSGVGIMQWLVMRRYVPRSCWWIPASAFAGLTLLAASDGAYRVPKEGLSGTLTEIGILIAGGVVMGMLQWLVLRRKVRRAGWWIAASIAGWGLIILMVRTSLFGGGDGGVVFSTIAGVALLAALTGATMVWLLRNQKNRRSGKQVSANETI